MVNRSAVTQVEEIDIVKYLRYRNSYDKFSKTGDRGN
jgi:hypothetical protein